jgi:hypothetical protein
MALILAAVVIFIIGFSRHGINYLAQNYSLCKKIQTINNL